ncbi:hypothetical protein ACPCHT_03715 [Nucisporomicrobium flavum]|uniref:SWIM zinc finger family protein n=1 Tax=Nucisporomicrobium flavum TaxID=2785915 RepID=UPI003C30348E
MTDRFSTPFVAMFEALRMAPTFARGRRDARAGHVRSLSISSSLVTAHVRGPDDTHAFRSRIAVRAFGAAEWSRVEDDLAAQARYVADLLAGRMPGDIEEVFRRAGLTLLPLGLDEVAMDCTCERWPMPCAHLAATCYALADSFETDPFGVFAWRGRGRDELLTRLSQLRGAAAHEPPAAEVPPEHRSAALGDIDDFWGTGTPAAPPPPPPVARPDLLLDQLDTPPLRYGGVSLTELLRPAYLALPPDDLEAARSLSHPSRHAPDPPR